ncbi:amino acid ABC transporter substrate-binding protein [Agrobacterium larrymoorei]|nr:amino acid ABC transporter substrate-binding protein [Agrobacterium larrymoorei]
MWHVPRKCLSLLTLLPIATALLLTPVRASDVKSPTLERIRETNTIVIGHREDEVPFAYRAPNGKVIGYSVEICEYIADHIKNELKLDRLDIAYLTATTATRFLLVKAGKIDLECSATTNTAERRGLVEFSYPHFITATRFVSKASSNLHRIRDLAGRTVASTTGTVNIEQLQNRNRADGLNISVLLAKRNSEGFTMVETNRASAFVMDGVLLAAQVAFSSAPKDYVISEETFGSPEPYGILMQKDDLAFKKLVNEALHQLFVSGEISRIYDKWFMSAIPPDGRNFNLPLSPDLRAAFSEPKEYLQ